MVDRWSAEAVAAVINLAATPAINTGPDLIIEAVLKNTDPKVFTDAHRADVVAWLAEQFRVEFGPGNVPDDAAVDKSFADASVQTNNKLRILRYVMMPDVAVLAAGDLADVRTTLTASVRNRLLQLAPLSARVQEALPMDDGAVSLETLQQTVTTESERDVALRWDLGLARALVGSQNPDAAIARRRALSLLTRFAATVAGDVSAAAASRWPGNDELLKTFAATPEAVGPVEEIRRLVLLPRQEQAIQLVELSEASPAVAREFPFIALMNQLSNGDPPNTDAEFEPIESLMRRGARRYFVDSIEAPDGGSAAPVVDEARANVRNTLQKLVVAVTDLDDDITTDAFLKVVPPSSYEGRLVSLALGEYMPGLGDNLRRYSRDDLTSVDLIELTRFLQSVNPPEWLAKFGLLGDARQLVITRKQTRGTLTAAYADYDKTIVKGPFVFAGQRVTLETLENELKRLKLVSFSPYRRDALTSAAADLANTVIDEDVLPGGATHELVSRLPELLLELKRPATNEQQTTSTLQVLAWLFKWFRAQATMEPARVQVTSAAYPDLDSRDGRNVQALHAVHLTGVYPKEFQKARQAVDTFLQPYNVWLQAFLPEKLPREQLLPYDQPSARKCDPNKAFRDGFNPECLSATCGCRATPFCQQVDAGDGTVVGRCTHLQCTENKHCTARAGNFRCVQGKCLPLRPAYAYSAPKPTMSTPASSNVLYHGNMITVALAVLAIGMALAATMAYAKHRRLCLASV